MADGHSKPKVKDAAYYARCAQELVDSEKAFVTTISPNIDGYWSSGDEDEGNLGRNLCLMARQMIQCDEG